jgi:hypothetical protein
MANERRTGRGGAAMHESAVATEQLATADPPVLVAILIAARRTGDRLLERVARRELEQHHRITIRFGEPVPSKPFQT